MLSLKKIPAVLLTAMLAIHAAALPAGAEGLEVEALKESLHPGRAVIIAFQADHEGSARITLNDKENNEVITVIEAFDVQPGLNRMYWNGTWEGNAAPVGEYRLTVTMDDETAEAPVTVSDPAPVISEVALPETMLIGAENTISFLPSQAGMVTVQLEQEDQVAELVEVYTAGESTQLSIPAEMIPADLFTNGEAYLILSMENDEGIASTFEYYHVDLTGGKNAVPQTGATEANDQSQYTPSYGTPYPITEEEARTYWGLPMDITDEEAVWQMLTKPFTMVTTGKGCTEKTQVTVREAPDADAKGVGVVTCLTQSVRVLETEGDWTLIECYSSSFHDSKVFAWNMLVQGWVPTRFLQTIIPSQKIGLVVDKLTQRMYVFKEGSLYATLLVSTGLANEKQPYNETRSGEFILVSTNRVGGFPSDKLICSLGIRYNSGDLVHEVPHTVNKDGSKNYATCEAKLGTRASHGCIRVQRKKTSEGVNMQWIWDNIEKNTKIVIWQDWQGRQIPYPSDELQVYYNPKGGEYYHAASNCYMASKVTFEPFSYGDIDTGAFASLKRCPYCTPAMRHAEIDAINEEHAPGGDHDPVLTEAREKLKK